MVFLPSALVSAQNFGHSFTPDRMPVYNCNGLDCDPVDPVDSENHTGRVLISKNKTDALDVGKPHRAISCMAETDEIDRTMDCQYGHFGINVDSEVGSCLGAACKAVCL